MRITFCLRVRVGELQRPEAREVGDGAVDAEELVPVGAGKGVLVSATGPARRWTSGQAATAARSEKAQCAGGFGARVEAVGDVPA